MEHLLEALLRPWLLLFVVLSVAIAGFWRRPLERPGRLLWVSLSLALLVLISIPAVGRLASGTLESGYDPAAPPPARPDVVVVLSGYMENSPEPGEGRLGDDTYYRCLHALSLYRRAGGCFILVSGGVSEGAPQGPALADAMRSFFSDHGVEPSRVWVENRSRTTHENAQLSSDILRSHGIHEIVLVTDAQHMPRAARCFAKEGIDVVPAPCRFATAHYQNGWEDYLPSPMAAARFQETCHEWLGLVYYRLRGWI